jgi:hypothetical protein
MTKGTAKIRLVLSCAACPEAYECFVGDKHVGYLRLRHGGFTVDYPDVGGERIYEARPSGDGCFDEDERDYYLRFAVDAILRRLDNGGPMETPEAPDVEFEVEGKAGFME